MGKLLGMAATRALFGVCLIGIALPAGAQTYSRTETTTYKDDLSKWVLGQVATVTCTAASPVNAGDNPCNGDVELSITYNSTSLLPETITKFGKAQGSIAYNTDGTIQSITDGNTNTTGFGSWKRGIPQAITYPATPDQPSGESESAFVNNDGTIAYTSDENSYRTCYTYDPMGRLETLTYPSETALNSCTTGKWAITTQDFAPSTSARYGLPAGHWVQTIATGDGYKVIDYDAMWRPVVENTYINGVSSSYSIVVKRYDASGRLAFVSYPVASLGSYTDSTLKGTDTYYDALDRVVSVQQDSELGLLTTSTAYLSGFKTQVTNPRGFNTVTSYQTYDQPTMDWPVSIQAADGRPVEENTDIVRDPFGKPLTITRHDPANTTIETRNYTYNSYQQLCRTDEPETGVTLMGYDDAGNLAWSAAGLPANTACNANGDTATILQRKAARIYDARNRLLNLSFPDGRGDQDWTYTPDGLPDDITTYNDAAHTVSVQNGHSYNHRRLLTGESNDPSTGSTLSIGYGYDANGHLTSQVWPDGKTAQFQPNALGQATRVDTGSGNPIVWNAAYYPNGALKSFTYGNGEIHLMEQNDRGLPEHSRDSYSGDTIALVDDYYEYDPNGNVAAILDGATGTAGRGSREMAYDALDRLMYATSPMFGNGSEGTVNYSHDALDNLTYVSMPATGPSNPRPAREWYYCYDPNTWQLTNIMTGGCTAGASVGAMQYDTQGNVTNKDGNHYDFDFGNRLRGAVYSGTTLETYQYDSQGRRMLSTAPTGTIRSLYSQGGQLLYQDNGRTGKRVNYYYLAGSLVNEAEYDVANGTYANRFQHTDALGSPVVVTNGPHAILERNEYEPYGLVLKGGYADRPGFTGHVADAQTGMDYMQQRYYDPMIGRFLSVDPVTATSVGGNFNRYWYASDNPYRFIDPDGRQDANAQEGRDATEKNERAAQLRAEHGQGPGTQKGTLSQSRVDGGIAESKYNGRESSGGTKSTGSGTANSAGSKGWHLDTLTPNYQVEGVAAYGAGVRYTRDWKTKKDAAGIVVLGVAARGQEASAFSGLPSVNLINTGYNWGNSDAPVDIEANFELGPVSLSLQYDPGTGINFNAAIGPSAGAYTGVSVMFDDTLVPDR